MKLVPELCRFHETVKKVFPRDRLMVKWMETRDGGSPNYYTAMKRGQEVPEHYVYDLLNYIFFQPDKTDEQLPSLQQAMRAYFASRGWSGASDPTHEEMLDLIAFTGERDFLQDPQQGMIAITTPPRPIGYYVTGAYDENRDIIGARTNEAALWIQVAGARLFKGDPTLNVRAALSLAADVVKINEMELQARLTLWSKIAPWSLVFTRLGSVRTGVSVVLPVTKHCYEDIRRGHRPIFDCDAADVALTSRHLLILASFARPTDLGGPSSRPSRALFAALLAQLGKLADTAPINPKGSHAEPLKVMSFMPLQVSKLQLIAGGFKPTGTLTAKSGHPLYEREASSTLEQMSFDIVYFAAMLFWSASVELPPT